MASPGSVTHWIHQLKAGDAAAAQKLWESYFQRLVNLALVTVLKQTLANVAGFLSLDADEPHFRLVLPAQPKELQELEGLDGRRNVPGLGVESFPRGSQASG